MPEKIGRTRRAKRLKVSCCKSCGAKLLGVSLAVRECAACRKRDPEQEGRDALIYEPEKD